ncbi:hypothetical protein BUALT_Bualt01G0171000 [Buddleja alternifolia]|uniref:Protein kinase domain-containing protein n=1 Tax=Buddleja alternifolia TaxID=168488 RepID=A0AAV6Y8V9_9LAMI|nr:hypothetical protein BUALT_Bualt01G0171000 [Buddleja alternifolia]
MNWTRGEQLGKGGFGFVSKAKTHQENLPPVIAVKSSNVSSSESLLKEKQVLDELKGSPFIIQCFGDDFTTENGEQLYNILMEYASGGCLVDRIGQGLPEHIVRRYTKSILTALSHIHKHGYVHCDIKPHNVLLVSNEDSWSRKNSKGTRNIEEEAKLADFGSCKKLKEGQKDCDFRGTVLYAAPESITRQEYSPESDVWSLGCTVLNMLTGKSPWKIDKNDEAKDVLFRIGISDAIPEIPSTENISREAYDFLNKCFVKDPTARSKVHTLLHHPFVAKLGNSGHLASKIFSHSLHSIIPHCFHHPKTSLVHAT